MNLFSKPKLFVDPDDIVFNSSEALVTMLKNDYTRKNIKYDESGLYNILNSDQSDVYYGALYNSSEFCDLIKISNACKEFFNTISKKFNVVFLVKDDGTQVSRKKSAMLISEIPNSKCITTKTSFLQRTFNAKEKNMIDMTNAIQIDAHCHGLSNTTASLNVLFTGMNFCLYNQDIAQCDGGDNIYCCSCWDDLLNILRFVAGNKSEMGV